MKRYLLGIWLIFMVFAFATQALAAEATYLLKAKVKVGPISKAKLIEIWIPVPPDDDFQKVESLDVSAPMSFMVTKEPEYGNKFVYLRKEGPLPKGAEIIIRAKVVRKEVAPTPWPERLPVRYLLSDKLVPIESLASLSNEICKGKKTQEEKLRAIYDYVVSHMKYDKSGKGWGRGDAIWACSAKRGNCTDFHSLFTALARAQGIPVVFNMGLPIPPKGGVIKGYHCWLWAFPDGKLYGIDASEAAKHPEKKEYFYGHLCENRIRLTRGRDILLAPAQHGERLNFIYKAYMEVDLKPSKDIQTTYEVIRNP
ncbi:transglutaminase-like domain-containing protein [Thermodesulfatator atlanticus]|uniref:transglutaminase-like domain-containing protein n=1 Tax=Thermodesulfatator atlanticus TaxID=501497 RepID=UPI0003B72268|nr:transglutaminase-like domain-containing protein [Thermodesulfatator atlanticus]